MTNNDGSKYLDRPNRLQEVELQHPVLLFVYKGTSIRPFGKKEWVKRINRFGEYQFVNNTDFYPNSGFVDSLGMDYKILKISQHLYVKCDIPANHSFLKKDKWYAVYGIDRRGDIILYDDLERGWGMWRFSKDISYERRT